MKYPSLFYIMLVLALPACTKVAGIEPEKSMETKPRATVDASLTTPILPTQALQEYGTPGPQYSQSPSSTGLDILIEEAREDLAQRLGVSIDSITVVAVIGQEFSSEAFHCKVSKERIARDESPDVTAGTTVLLQAAGHRYEYHASDRTVIFCRKVSQ